ncbi:MAG TPA: S8 family serine peptidase [Pirellulales bacterium]|jgi:kumamolisin|nr:S8 family serine peptidase [Pirellulales bacterium]
MKICPFCREQIHDEAVKCRYCCSRLSAEPVDDRAAQVHDKPGPGQIVYIVDRDLIRFGKFAAAVLGIFITVGVCIWGFDVTKAAKEVHASSEQARTIQSELNKTKEDIQLAKEKILAASGEINANRERTQELLAKAQDLVESISEKEQQATVFIARIVKRSSAVNEPTAGFSVPELARLYNFPAKLDGTGQTIGIIELGGGYRASDLDAYFADLMLPRPTVTDVSVLGARNMPASEPDDVDEIVTVNLEVAAAIAPRAHIVVYFAPADPDGFIEAVRTAVHDEENRPSVLLISWGSPENNWTKSAMNQMDQVLQAAARRDITVVCAAGNSGATDGVADGEMHVDFPASSPWVLACGGTHLVAAAGTITAETIWNDGDRGATGGGVSRVFPAPQWQQPPKGSTELELTGRGVPDVAANASPSSGFRLYVHGNRVVLGGTSAATPLWAGLVALLNQGCGRNLGHINPALYGTMGPAGALHGVAGAKNAPPGGKPTADGQRWSVFTGWGSPDGAKLLEAFQKLEVEAD